VLPHCYCPVEKGLFVSAQDVCIKCADNYKTCKEAASKCTTCEENIKKL
jgi:hypothetical protein